MADNREEQGLLAQGFLTAAGKGESEHIVEKSRFIGLVSPVESPDDVEIHLQETKRQYPNARHYVYAYRLHKNKAEKSSDDGEPQGTGGRPLLDLLQHRQLWNVQIVVVRYFGGILLGTGGLTRAYAGAARLALEQAGITELKTYAVYRLSLEYSWYEQLKYALKQKGFESGEESFLEKVALHIYVPAAESAEFESWIDNLTNKQVAWEREKIVLK